MKSIVGNTSTEVVRDTIDYISNNGLKIKRPEGPNKEKVMTMREAPSLHLVLEDPTKNWCGIPNVRQQVGVCLVEVMDYLLGLNPGFIHHFHPYHKRWLLIEKWRQSPIPYDEYHQEPPDKDEKKELCPYTYGDRIRHWPGRDLPIKLDWTHKYDYEESWMMNNVHSYNAHQIQQVKPKICHVSRKEVPVRTWEVDQLEVCIEKLQRDPTTRHAIISFWNPMHDHSRQYVPCTMSWQFEVREGRVDMHCTIRSNDAIWGLPFDLFDPTIFQQLVASRLGLEVGKFYQVSNNMHIYMSRHKNIIPNIIAEQFEIYDHFDPEPMPPMTKEEMNGVLEWCHDIIKTMVNDFPGSIIRTDSGLLSYATAKVFYGGITKPVWSYWRFWLRAIACDWYREMQLYELSCDHLDYVTNEWWVSLAQRLYESVEDKDYMESLTEKKDYDKLNANHRIRERILKDCETHNLDEVLFTEYTSKWEPIPIITKNECESSDIVEKEEKEMVKDEPEPDWPGQKEAIERTKKALSEFDRVTEVKVHLDEKKKERPESMKNTNTPAQTAFLKELFENNNPYYVSDFLGRLAMTMAVPSNITEGTFTGKGNHFEYARFEFKMTEEGKKCLREFQGE